MPDDGPTRAVDASAAWLPASRALREVTAGASGEEVKVRKRDFDRSSALRPAHAHSSSQYALAVIRRFNTARALGGAAAISTGACPSQSAEQAAPLSARQGHVGRAAGAASSTGPAQAPMLFEPAHLSRYASGPRARSSIVNARLARQVTPSRPPVRLGFEVRIVGSTRSIT